MRAIAEDHDSLWPLVRLLQTTTGLAGYEAKTVIYWATAAYRLPKLDEFPILAIQGPPGTGKSTLLKTLGHLTYKPKFLDGGVSKAELRDSLASTPLALLEEADRANETLLGKRFARRTSITSVKRKAADGWPRVALNLFGATALHRRIPLKDPAVQSRSIVLKTHRSQVTQYKDEDFQPYAQVVQQVASRVSWDEGAQDGPGRIRDTWKTLLFVAASLGDGDWLTYAEAEIAKGQANLDAGQGEEPTEIVFRALLECAIGDEFGDVLLEVSERVLLGNVVKGVSERGQSLNPWQVGQVLRDLGFEVRTNGGQQYVYTGGIGKLVAVGEGLRLQDDWLERAAEELALPAEV